MHQTRVNAIGQLVTKDAATESSPEALRSIFVPPYAHQGQEMSCHVLWDPTRALTSCRIELEPGLKLVHVYNVPESGLSAAGRGEQATIARTTENGYIGFVMKSEILANPDVTLAIRIEAAFEGGQELERVVQRRLVRLFRPDLRLLQAPSSVKVSFGSNDAAASISERIVLENKGEGTSFIIVEPAREGGLELVDFFEAEGATKRLIEFMIRRFDDLREEYPKHVDLLKTWSRFVRMLGDGRVDEALREVPALQEMMRGLARADPLILEDLGAVFEEAFRSTFTADERFTGWIKGFEAMKNQRVVLLNPWASIPLRRGVTDTRLVIRPYDQLGTAYAPLPEIRLRLETAGDGLLPLHQLVILPGIIESETGKTRAEPV